VTRTIQTRDGHELLLREELASRPAATLAVLHGYAEHSGRYAHVMGGLRERGISTVAVDLRGHGHSPGPRGHVERFEDYHLDLEALLGAARERSEGSPVALFGHSNGGLIIAHWRLSRGEEEVLPTVITSPYLGLALPVPAPKLWAGRVLARWVPRLNMPSTLTGVDVCTDPAVQRAYEEDELVLSTANVRWFVEAERAQGEVLAGAGGLRGPWLVLYAGNDRVADPACTADLLDRMTGAELEAQRLDGFGHEVLNEPGHEALLDRITAWILSRARTA